MDPKRNNSIFNLFKKQIERSASDSVPDPTAIASTACPQSPDTNEHENNTQDDESNYCIFHTNYTKCHMEDCILQFDADYCFSFHAVAETVGDIADESSSTSTTIEVANAVAGNSFDMSFFDALSNNTDFFIVCLQFPKTMTCC